MPAAGRASRMGEDKLLADVGGRPLVALTLAAAAAAGIFGRLVLVAPAGRHEVLHDIAAAAGFDDVVVVNGGDRRQESVRRGLAAVGACDIVVVHDAARPLCPPSLFVDCAHAAAEHGAATAAVAVVDSIARTDGELVVESLERTGLVAVQTPQAFRHELLVAAHDQAAEGGARADDDAALVAALGTRVRVITGSVDNFKVTHPRDLVLLRALAAASA